MIFEYQSIIRSKYLIYFFKISLTLIYFLISFSSEASQSCRTKVFEIDSDFLSANFSRCEILSENLIRLYLSPEDNIVVNPSPWFAFRKSSHKEQISIELLYEKFTHRYLPKISTDLVNWKKIDDSMIKIQDNNKKVTLTFKPDVNSSYVAAQEILSSIWYEDWYNEIRIKNNVSITQNGRTDDKRYIKKISIGNNKKNPHIILLGRQHPPEITGAIALREFINELLDDDNISKKFLKNFNLIVYPLINPDGVDLGHWRHNSHSKDLNRDWGFFTQLETKIINDDIMTSIKNNEAILLIDFHSTIENIFYIQNEDDLKGYKFANEWLSKNSNNLKNYEYSIKPTINKKNGVAKNYFNSVFSIPTITYEVGDNTNREAIKSAARKFANSMMIILLNDDSTT